MSPKQTKPSFASPIVPAALYPYWRGRIYAILGLLVLLVIVVALATAIGSVDIPLFTISSILLSKLPFAHVTPSWTSAWETWRYACPGLFCPG